MDLGGGARAHVGALPPPFRAEGLFRRTAPFVAPATIGALALFDADLRDLRPAVLGPLGVCMVLVASFLVLPWERLPRPVPALPLAGAWALALSRGGEVTAIGVLGVVVMVGAAGSLYVVPWDRLPRWCHNLAPLGALAALVLIRAGLDARADIVFPIALIAVAWLALHHTRRELEAGVAIALAVFLVPTPSAGVLSGSVTRLLYAVVTLVLGVTMNALVSRARDQAAELGALRDVARRLSSTLDLDAVLAEVVEAAVGAVAYGDPRGLRATVMRLEAGQLRSVAELAPGDEARFTGHVYELGRHPRLAAAVRTREVVTGEMRATEMADDTRRAVAGARIDGYALLPLVVEDDVFGLLTVSARARSGFGRRETERLVALTDVAALAIRNALIYRRERRMAHGLAALARTNLALTQETDVGRLLQAVADGARELAGADVAAVTMLSADGRATERVTLSPADASGPAAAAVSAPGVTTAVLRSREALSTPRAASGGEGGASGPRAGVAWLGTALRLRRDVIGCVCVAGTPDRTGFGDDDAVLLNGLAAQAAVSVANARLLERLGELATTDPLTGLRNRRDFERALGSLPRLGFALLAIDLDDLKAVNDEFGHEAGDVIIQVAGATLGALLRGGDLIARVGGDEFAALLLDIDEAAALEVAERMRTALHGVALPHGRARVSIGCACGPPGADPHAVWKAADEALYEAKRSGRDRTAVSVGAARSDRVATQARWNEALHAVLDDHAVGMVYQPIVSLGDGAVVAYEALARPSGPCPPGGVEGLFAAAQRVGRMRDLDWLCRRAALEGARGLPPGTPLFVNVSATALLDPIHDADQVLLLLEWAGHSPESLVLEITERETMRDLRRLTLVAAAYREHGIRFAIDDVGEGHSTLEVMAAVSPEFIKVASSLVAGIRRAGSRAAVQAVTAFAATTGAAVIAEGVENEAAVTALRELGVPLGQGYWLGRPAPPPAVARRAGLSRRSS